jgi:hypothetical protein
MSFFSIIGKLLGIVPEAVAAVRSIADAARKHDVPRDISRKHDWQFGLSVPPVCAFCRAPQTKLNVNGWCPAFEVHA